MRDASVVERVKGMYGNTCQICSRRVDITKSGLAYSEVAHIHAVGKPYEGPDVVENAVCLCPLCHVKMDRGVLQITDDFEVLDTLEMRSIGPLNYLPEHGIRVEYLGQHRSRWPGSLDFWNGSECEPQSAGGPQG